MNEKTEFQRGFSTEKTISTIPPAVLSHYVSGDTPTLYASTKPNSSSYTNEQQLPNNQGGTAFTFFGMPIPPLNFNNIWSQTKGTGKRVKDSRRNSLPKKATTVEQDGFTPMLPGTGGFRPSMATPDHPFFGEEMYEEEEEIGNMYRNKSLSNKIKGSGGHSTYHFSSTTDTPFHYDRFTNSDSYSKFINITTRDSLFESATINSIIRPTAKPSQANNQQQTATGISQSDDTVSTSENPHKLSTGKITINFKLSNFR